MFRLSNLRACSHILPAIAAAIALVLVPAAAVAGSKGGSHHYKGGKGHYSYKSSGHRRHYNSGSVSRSGVSLGTYGLKASSGHHHGKKGHHGKYAGKGHHGKYSHRHHHGKKRHYSAPEYAGHYYGGHRHAKRRIYRSSRYYTSGGALIISVGGSHVEEEGATDYDYRAGSQPILENGCAPGEYCTMRLGNHPSAPKIITRNETGKPIN